MGCGGFGRDVSVGVVKVFDISFRCVMRFRDAVEERESVCFLCERDSRCVLFAVTVSVCEH